MTDLLLIAIHLLLFKVSWQERASEMASNPSA